MAEIVIQRDEPSRLFHAFDEQDFVWGALQSLHTHRAHIMPERSQ
jgi:hypothetical protein